MSPLAGYTVGVTADRRSDEQMSILTGRGAKCVHGPTIKTHALRPEAEVRAATEAFLSDPPDIVVLTTGIGVRGWLEAADAIMLGDDLRRALAGASLVSRGPKAKGAAVTAELEVEWNAASATSVEVLKHLRGRGVEGLRIGVQLDGSETTPMLDAIAALGAEPVPIPVYRWSMPDDLGPAERLVRAVADHQIDALTFTARPAVENFCAVAANIGLFDDIARMCGETVEVFAVGPVCATSVVSEGLGEPHQPERHRLGAMVQQLTMVLAERSGQLQIAGCAIKLQGRRVIVDGAEPVWLTDRERQLLDVLLERPGTVRAKSALLKAVWSGEQDEHVVEVNVGRLRQKLGPAGAGLETVIRRGYRISEN